MTLQAIGVVAAGLIGLGVYGTLSQQSIVMLMMGLELIINGVLLATVGFWSLTTGGLPEGQLLAIVAMAVMAVEMAIGFALVVAVFRRREVDMTDRLGSMKH
ncbi:MAG: NADH-quinone oxidoreductase subunit NuoK [Thiohalocapsa sp.]|jgi:NAD(P)H-quinone oxidoreductase subunit 4L|uniref:NADH-quinone oxidoreductase subunit NuoK n=1 Tax=Thiohalocapsa sp. TaxID=2497641 RepID=UPI0025F0206E|nr:NADH-quinone oxidoreductase subunit NuoK [Thiohalocapsa sp.]MCG6941653.1 NADH-quinone oxidoreductase subunit NuoK [Thiohalocapsa sp.]